MTQAAFDPRAWTAATVDRPQNWYDRLSPRSLEILDGKLRDLRQEPLPTTHVRLSPAERDALGRELAGTSHSLEEGRGFVIVEGLPPDHYTRGETQAIYWLVGQALGIPFEQNVAGTLLYDVKDTGKSLSEGARFSVTSYESSFHTDNSFGESVLDIVGLLCLQTARSGGINQIVSGYSAYSVLRQAHPDALAVLSRPFHVDRRGGVKEGQTPTIQLPVIEETSQGVLFRYLRYWIEAGHEKVGVPLTPTQVAALDTLDRVLRQPDLRVEFGLKRGQMLFLNNRWLLHNRTAFEDYEDPEQRRHLVRLWLQAA